MVKAKSVSAFEHPNTELYWSEDSWSEDDAWNPIGAGSKVKTRCNVSGVPWPRGARGESSHQDHAQEEISSERAVKDEEDEQDVCSLACRTAHFSAHSALSAYFAHLQACDIHTWLKCLKRFIAHVSLFSFSPSPLS